MAKQALIIPAPINEGEIINSVNQAEFTHAFKWLWLNFAGKICEFFAVFTPAYGLAKAKTILAELADNGIIKITNRQFQFTITGA
jgi:hypothetical protein